MKGFDSKLSHVSILANVLYITRDTSESSDSSPDIIFSSILFIVVVLRLMLPLKFVSQATRTHSPDTNTTNNLLHSSYKYIFMVFTA